MAVTYKDRIALRWSREQLARASGISVAAVYLFERMGTAGLEDDVRIRSTLIQLSHNNNIEKGDCPNSNNKEEPDLIYKTRIV